MAVDPDPGAADGEGRLLFQLTSSSTSLRTSSLSSLRDKIRRDEIQPEQLPAILRLLFQTHPYYADRPSRTAVRNCLGALYSSDRLGDPSIKRIIAAIKNEAQKPSIATSNAFVLLEWSSDLLTHSALTAQAFDSYAMDIVPPMVGLLDLCLGSPHAKSSLKEQALRLTRRGFRATFKDAGGVARVKVVIERLTAKRSGSTQRNSVLLGVVCGVCARLSRLRGALEAVKGDIYAHYTREILGSRTVVPDHLAHAMRDFFSAFTTTEDFESELASPLERSLLRAPEVVLSNLAISLLISLPPRVDLSKPLAEKLLKQLLSCTKSTNPTIRNGALAAFTAAISRCGDEGSLDKIVDEILDPLKSGKLSSLDQRALHASMLDAVPVSVRLSQKIPIGLSGIVSKEPNEAVVVTLSSVVLKHTMPGLAVGNALQSPTLDAIKKGLADKRPAVRRAWFLRVGDAIWSLPEKLSGAEQDLCSGLVDNFVAVWSEVIANPLPAAQSGLVTAANIALAVLMGRLSKSSDAATSQAVRKADIIRQSLATTPKLSFLLNHRVYSKLSTDDDFKWAVRALAATARHVVYETEHAECWAAAFLYTTCAHNVSPEAKRAALSALSSAYTRYPENIGKVLLNGIWQWLRAVEDGNKDCATASAKTAGTRLKDAISAICSKPMTSGRGLGEGSMVDEEVLKTQLVNLCVVSHHELMPGVSWISLCQKAGVDPGQLATERATKLVSEIRMYTGLSGKSPYIRDAALKSAATLAFVAPDAITPLIVNLFEGDLNPQILRGVSAQDVSIWQTPAGVAFVDVLSQSSSTKIQEKSKDADTLRWEAELRAQLAKKKGAERKLSPDEKAKVDEQLAKEAIIRTKVEDVSFRLSRGVGIIQSLAKGAPTAVEMWMGRAVKSLLRSIEAGAGMIIHDKAITALRVCSDHVSPRLGVLRPFIGIACVRALNANELSQDLQAEPLGALCMRLLYRLRFAGEQRQFDTISLFYILPLIFLILTRGGVGVSAPEEIDEQVVLALEFLSIHTEACSKPNLPRGEILNVLLHAMQHYSVHYKTIKDCLLDLCRCMSTSITPTEIDILIDGVINPEVNVRTAALQTMQSEVDLTDLDFSEKMWIACHDEVEENVEIAKDIWEENVLEAQDDSAAKMIPYLQREDKQLRGAAARALAESVALHPAVFDNVLNSLVGVYREKVKPIVPQRDEYGMLKKVDTTDPWEARSGVALAFKELAGVFDDSKLVEFSRFLIEDGALADRNNAVRDEMIEAATAIISAQGSSHVEELMKTFEETLETPDDGSEVRDKVNEAVIILYGALGRHLGAGDPRVTKVLDRLLATLSTPSETVQYAVAECLPPLVKTARENTSDYIQMLLDQLFNSKGYASRRGAAYGLAGIIKGYGISALKDFRVMTALKAAVEDKKNPNARQGALFAFELLSLILGRLFEPYVIQIMPMLLQSFGDPVLDVREACSDAAKVCFSSLSAYGVTVILPDLLEGLEDTAWRSKKGAVETLGAMAYLAPHQLAVSLPEIIPPLTTVLNDSHKEVRGAANRSLKKFGEVINNPEIKELVGVLLKALSDPTKYTDDALDALMKVNFVHYLDSPSLALIVRILERGLSDRSATKRKASQIIGSLAHLTDRKDLMVHIPILVSGLKQAIVDPVPATRATASKALGSLVEKLGEEALPDIIPGLMATLKSDTGTGDRLGSAQALSEVLSGLGTQRLEETLPTILQNANSSKPSVREGFMSLFIFLPACFGNSFSAYLNRIIPPILAGLADDVESIRDVSLRAGRLLVKNFATRAIDLLLPELERGLADANHRIRLSSVELVGDLLFNLTGISGKTEQEEDDETSAEVSGSLLEVLGQEKRDRVLSALYICRCDTSGQVRLAAVQVWKALVSSPRTLKDLVPTLTQLIIRRLASSNLEQKVIAGQALGELIKKAGEGVLSTLLPTLEEGLRTATDADAKQGICMALKELVTSTAEDALEDYETTLVSVVRMALVDSDSEVREAAAEAFDSLQKVIGKRAVDQVLPHLLSLLQSKEEADQALAALLTLLTEQTRSSIILPVLIPTLISSPITRFNCQALAALARVAGSALNRRLPQVMNALIDNIISCEDPELLTELNLSFDAVILSVDEFDGLNSMMSEMLKLVKHDDHLKRAAACAHFAKFFAETDLDYSRYTQDCIRVLLISFDDRDKDVVKNAWNALNELTKKLKKEEMESLVYSTRQVLLQVGVAGHELPGFILPKGINAILPIFLQGLMYGTPEQRTQSALAISDIIDRSSDDSLRPFVTQITGPLIRVVSERSVDVKAAILLTLNSLLQKIPMHLKPFLPQLQRTFAKSLADTSSDLLRTRAAKALGTLITLTPRIDPLISELVAGAKTNDTGVKDAMLKALYEVVSKAGSNMGDASKSLILSLIEDDLDEDDDRTAIAGARLLGVLVRYLSRDDAAKSIKSRAFNTTYTRVSVLGLNAVLLESPGTLQDTFPDETPTVISQGISHKTPFVSDNCVLAAGKYLISDAISKNFEIAKGLLESLAQAIKAPVSGSTDTKRLSLVVIRTVSRLHFELIRPHLSLLAPVVFSCVRDMIIPVKLSAEQAFLAMFQVSQKGDAIFDKYITAVEGSQKRSMNDYFRRVALKLAAAEKERNEAGGAGLGLNSDEQEDVREIMSVGRVDLEADGWVKGV